MGSFIIILSVPPAEGMTLQNSQKKWLRAGSLFALDFKRSQSRENKEGLRKNFLRGEMLALPPLHHGVSAALY